jgi:hypothetical protein
MLDIWRGMARHLPRWPTQRTAPSIEPGPAGRLEQRTDGQLVPALEQWRRGGPAEVAEELLVEHHGTSLGGLHGTRRAGEPEVGERGGQQPC